MKTENVLEMKPIISLIPSPPHPRERKRASWEPQEWV